jgi:hypothetical protein
MRGGRRLLPPLQGRVGVGRFLKRRRSRRRPTPAPPLKGRGSKAYAIARRPRRTVALWPTLARGVRWRIVSTNSQSLRTCSGVIVSAI